jgi:putative ABC transport system permease protein
VARAANVTYLTMQVRQGRKRDVRAMVVGVVPGGPGEPGQPGYLIAGPPNHPRPLRGRGRHRHRLQARRRIRIRRNDYTVVGLTRRMVSSGGDPMVFIPLKDAQEAQFLKDNDAIVPNAPAPPPIRRSTGPACPGVLDAVIASQSVNPSSTPCWCRSSRASTPERWPSPSALEAAHGLHPGADGGDPDRKLIATSAKQIGMFLVILAIVSAAIVAFIIYTLTLGKIREIAVLKLIGTKNRTIAAMILQQAVGLGVIGFVVGKIAATFWAPFFPKYVSCSSRATPRAASSP